MKRISIVLALIILIATVISACNSNNGNTDNTGSTAAADTNESAPESTQAPVSEVSNDGRISGESGAFNSFSLQKIGSVDLDYKKVNISGSGIIYSDGKQYGFMSLDGNGDTGLKYDHISKHSKEIGNSDCFYEVCFEAKDSKDLNYTGLINSNAEVVIEPKYAIIKMLNERYAEVITDTGKTDSKDDALFYVTSEMFSISPSDDDEFHTGKWEIYDILNKKLVSGVSGKSNSNLSAYGQFISYRDDNGNTHQLDGNGNELTDNRQLLNDGYYSVRNGDSGTFYSSDGKKLFDYDAKGVTLFSVTDNGFIKASKYSNGSSSYFLLDMTGNKVTPDFENNITYIFPTLIYSDNKIYDYNGNQVVDGEWTSFNYDDDFHGGYYAHNDKSYIVLDKDGKVVYRDETYDDKNITHGNFYIAKKDSDGKYVNYSFKDNDFTLYGDNLTKWLFRANSTNKKDLLDSCTGETVLNSYEKYEYTASPAHAYILAYNDSKAFDVYVVN